MSSASEWKVVEHIRGALEAGKDVGLKQIEADMPVYVSGGISRLTIKATYKSSPED